MNLILDNDEIKSLNNDIHFCYINTKKFEPSKNKIFINKCEYKTQNPSIYLNVLKSFFKNYTENLLNQIPFSFGENENSFFFTINNLNLYQEKMISFKLRNTILVADDTDLSICADYYYSEANKMNDYSTIGNLLHEVKINKNVLMSAPLNLEINNIIDSFDFNIYGQEFIIVPIPSSSGVVASIANAINAKTSNRILDIIEFNLPNKAKNLTSKSKRLKNLNGNVKINCDNQTIDNKRILLIDDNYQSGVTINYVAKLIKKSYNVSAVYSFCLAKTAASLSKGD